MLLLSQVMAAVSFCYSGPETWNRPGSSFSHTYICLSGGPAGCPSRTPPNHRCCSPLQPLPVLTHLAIAAAPSLVSPLLPSPLCPSICFLSIHPPLAPRGTHSNVKADHILSLSLPPLLSLSLSLICSQAPKPQQWQVKPHYQPFIISLFSPPPARP